MRISDWSSDVCSSDLLDHRKIAVVGEETATAALIFASPGAGVVEILLESGFEHAQPFFIQQLRHENIALLAICLDLSAVEHRLLHFASLVSVSTSSEGHTSKLNSILRNTYVVLI